MLSALTNDISYEFTNCAIDEGYVGSFGLATDNYSVPPPSTELCRLLTNRDQLDLYQYLMREALQFEEAPRQNDLSDTDVDIGALIPVPRVKCRLESELERCASACNLLEVEDDALGEELRVVWELEPGTSVLERASMPELTGFDNPVQLDAFLNAVRWGAVSQTDTSTLQAPFRAGIEIEDYQLDPLARAIQMPRVNLLIADDVGLGKTIESGLVVQEMMLRHRIRAGNPAGW